MAKRFTDTEIWDKEWFMNLSPKIKCLIRFIFDKCDVAGIWQPNWTLASTYIGEKVTEKDLRDIQNQIEKLPCGKIFVPEFIYFQYGELSEKCKPHLKVISILKKYNLYERVLKGYTSPIERVEEKEKEKEKEEDKEKEREEDNNTGSVEFFLWPTFEDFWDEYDKKIGEKEKIRKKWENLKQQEKEKIMAYIPNYKLSEPDKKYRKNPETFLNNKSWNDELIFKNNGQKTYDKNAEGRRKLGESIDQILQQARDFNNSDSS